MVIRTCPTPGLPGCVMRPAAAGFLGIQLSVVSARVSHERAHKSGCGHLSKRLDAPVVIGSVVTSCVHFFIWVFKTLGVPDWLLFTFLRTGPIFTVAYKNIPRWTLLCCYVKINNRYLKICDELISSKNHWTSWEKEFVSGYCKCHHDLPSNLQVLCINFLRNNFCLINFTGI